MSAVMRVFDSVCILALHAAAKLTNQAPYY